MLNRIVLMGRLAADPELKTTNSGKMVSSFRIGVARNYSRDQIDWISVTAWNNTAKFVCNYFSKGQLVALEGALLSRQWQGRDGNNHTSYEVQAEHVWFAEGKKQASAKIDVQDYEEISSGDDLPF